MVFRSDIQGLRAIAVLAVLLFHINNGWLPGGYLGVDIFFVISGYLITANIVRDIELQRFSFLTFFRRRASRLFPAGGITIIMTLVVGYFTLSPDQIMDLAGSAIAAIGLHSNIYYWSSVGYFDLDASLKPLLHTWSLGVEQQFYIFWPIALVVCSSMSRKILPIFVALVGVASFVCAQILVTDHHSLVFYWMPFRIFEFSLGAMLAFLAQGSARRLPNEALAGWAGVAAIFASVAFLEKHVPMPSFWSLLPCAGAAAVIYGGRHPALQAFLGCAPMVFIGRISYSLYLVHWPIILLSPTGTNPVVLIVGSAIAAILLYFLVEQPFDTGNARRQVPRLIGLRTSGVVCAGLAVAGVSLSSYAFATQGRLWRPAPFGPLPTAVEMWEERKTSVNIPRCFIAEENGFDSFDKAFCLEKQNGKKNVLVVGDSFAADLYAALRQAYPSANFLQATAGNCTPTMTGKHAQTCADMLDYIFNDFLNRNAVDAVVICANWVDSDLRDLVETIATLNSRKITVAFAAPPVRFVKNVPDLIYEAASTDRGQVYNYVMRHRTPADDVNIPMRMMFEGKMPYIDIEKSMCAPRCEIFTQDDKLVVLDFGHLTLAGAAHLASRLASRYPDMF